MKKLLILFVGLLMMAIDTRGQGVVNDASFNVYDNGVNTFGGADGSVDYTLLQPDGKIMIAGYFDRFNGIVTKGVARLNADGSLDNSFTSRGEINVRQVIQQPDGKYLLNIVGGTIFFGGLSILYHYDGEGIKNWIRINLDGSLDQNFNTLLLSYFGLYLNPGFSNPGSTILSMALQNDNKILVADRKESIIQGSYVYSIKRLNSDGSQDILFPVITSLLPNLYNSNNTTIIPLSTGKIIVSKYLKQEVTVSEDELIRLTPGHLVDPSFGQIGLTNSVKNIIELPNGKTLYYGADTVYAKNGISRHAIVLLNADETIDAGFNYDPDFNDPANVKLIRALPNGKFIVFSTNASGNEVVRILDSNGSVDNSFNLSSTQFQGGNNGVPTLTGSAILENNKFLISGHFNSYNNIPRHGIARIIITNDEPCDAISLTPADVCSSPVLGNVSLAGNNNTGNCNSNSNPDVWYKFTATDTRHVIKVTGNGNFQPTVSLHSGNTCSTVSSGYIGCASASLPGGEASLSQTNLTIGTTYYIRVSHLTNTAPTNTTFNICVLNPAPNDEPCNAIGLLADGIGIIECTNATTGDISAATYSGHIGCDAGNKDAWYKFLATSNTQFIKVIGNGNFIPGISVHTGLSCNSVNTANIGCIHNAGSNVVLRQTGLTIGTEYYIRVANSESNSSSDNTFQICLRNPTPYDEPCTAGTLTASPSGVLTCTNPILGDIALATNDGLITYIDPLPYHEYRNNDLWFKFVATQPTCLVRLDQDGDFRSAVNLYGSNDCNTVGSSIQNNVSYNSVFVTRYSGLITGNTYYLQVGTRDTATFSSTFSICLLTGLPQDEICGAIDLPNSLPLSVDCNNEQSGDFNFATKSLTGACNTQNDFWYKFTATHTTHIIKTTNVGNIAVYAASTCNGTLTQLYCNNGSFAENKYVPVKNLTVGSTYFVAIGVIGLQNNLFTICQTAVENDEPCGAIPIATCVPIQVDAGFGTNTLNSTCQSHTAHQVIQGSTVSYVFDDVQLKDLWYKFTAVSNRAELTLSGTNLTGLFPLRITLRIATFTDCNNLSGINIIADCIRSLSPFNVPLNNLTIGQEYYIAISNGDKDLENVLGTNFTMELRGATSSVAISAVPAGPVCSGAPVTFTATPTNGGDAPQYEWSVNDIVVVGTANTYSTLSLQNGDVVSCKLTSSNCVTPLSVSQSVTMQVFPTPVWYADADGDGFGNLASIVLACFQPNGYVSDNTDCDDTDVTKHRTFIFYADNDGDGYGVEPGVQVCAAAAYPPPSGFGSASGDPDDNNGNIYPGVIGQAEYFIDIDPGAGSGTAIPISNPLVNLNFSVSVPVNSLATGFHFLSIRLNAYGEGWGLFEKRGFLVTAAPIAYGGNIVAAEYFIDTDPGAGSSNPIAVANGDIVNENTGILIPNNLALGFHSLSIRVKDAAGNWSLFERRVFKVEEASGNVTPIIAAEFFINNDPGAGNGIVIPIATDDTVIANLPLQIPLTVPGGTHKLAIRVKDAAGKWSLFEHRNINVTPFIGWFQDADGDGYGNLLVLSNEPIQPPGYVSDNTDCNDANANVYPGALEICNGIDDNCDGVVDLGFMSGLIVYLPMNGNANDAGSNALNGTIVGSVSPTNDRFGNTNSAMSFPGNAGSHIRIDDNPLLRPSSITLSSWVNITSLTSLSGFISKSINCINDSWHFGNEGGNYSTWVSNSTACGDFVQMTSPLTVGTWKHIVFTLDAIADTRKMYIDGVQVASATYTSNIPYDGNPVLIGAAIENGGLAFPLNGKLDDVMIFNRAITAAEVNTLFSNGAPFTSLPATYYADVDGDGFGNPAVSTTGVCGTTPSGFTLNNTDCDDAQNAVNPNAIEICDGIDNDCDGQTDEGVLIAFYADVDADGFGNPSVSQLGCTQPVGYVANNTDCNDANATVYMNAPELCDGIDNDCDTQIDEGIDCFTRFAVTGGGTYCFGSSGVVVGLAGSNVGVSYQLKRGTINDGPALPGTGNPLSFGLKTITAYYSVLATKVSTSQQQTMLNTVKVARVSIALAPSKPGAITGPVNVCPFLGPLNEATYSIRLAGNATSYVWVVPNHASIISGQGDSSIRVQFDSSFISGIISVQSINSCANRTSAFRTLTVAVPATTMQAISGPVDVCSFLPDVVNPTGIPVEYTVDFNVTAPLTISSYIWNVSPGITIMSGLNTNSIRVLFSSNPNNDVRTISVSGFASDCINNKFATINTNSNPPGNSLTGKSISTSNTNVCAANSNIIYTLSGIATPGNTLLWTVPTGATIISGQGSNSIAVSYSMQYLISGFVTVRETNTCGIGAVVISRTISNPVIPSTPSPIVVTTLSNCPNRTIQYTIGNAGNALGYVWSVPSNGTIISGQNTMSIAVSYRATASGTNDVVAVYSYNNCSNSASTRTLPVKLLACAPAFAGKGNPEPPLKQPVASTNNNPLSEVFSTQLFPNPTNNVFNLKVITAEKETIQVRLMDATGRLIKHFVVQPYQSMSFGAELKAGIYMVEVKQGASTNVRRIVKF